MGSAEPPKEVSSTIHEYDTQQAKAAFKSQMMGVAMMAFMHLYLKYTNPLLVQSIIPLKGAFEANLIRIHVLGQAASGELKRPFKAAPNLLSALGGAPPTGETAETAGETKTEDNKAKSTIEASSSKAGAKEE